MEASFQSIAFDPADARAALKQLPEDSAVFALYGEAVNAEPYIGRTPKATRCLIDANAFPSVRTDGRIMLDVRDLDRWIDSGKYEVK